MRLASWGQPPYKARRHLARYGPVGYISAKAQLYGQELSLAPGCFVDDDVVIFQHPAGGPVRLAARVHLYRSCIIETGPGGSLSLAAGKEIGDQPLRTKGGIVVEDGAWLGVGVIVLDGVTIGAGAIVGAGAVVTQSVPANAIAIGVPARVVGERH